MPSLSRFPIVKVSATGNDFLLVDLTNPAQLEIWNSEFGSRPRADLAREWCDRHRGLGADGLVVLETDPALDFKWDFYNSDGSVSEMCGNATRAVSLYFHSKTKKNLVRFNTATGAVSARVNSPDDIQVELSAIQSSEWDLLSADGTLPYSFVSTGNPHALVSVEGLKDKAALRVLAAKIKAEKRFLQAGVNVTFVHTVNGSLVESQTFERGVEDFTLSCGTGAVAAAFSILRGQEGASVEVRVPGGKLFVVWNNGRPTLSGPARIVAEMRLIG